MTQFIMITVAVAALFTSFAQPSKSAPGVIIVTPMDVLPPVGGG